MFSPKILLQNMLINEKKTGNQFYDYIINFIILSLIAYLFQNINVYKNKIIHLSKLIFKQYEVQILIEATNVKYDRNGVKMSKLIYSNTFQAIVFYIKELNLNDIYTKRESDKCEKANIIFDLFIPDQYEPFLIDKAKSIYCIIKMNENKSEYINEKDRVEIQKSHHIRLFSKDKNTKMSDLEDFIEICLLKYKKYNDDKTVQDQYYFCFNNSDDDDMDTLNFSEKKFNTNRTFSTIFFENKDKYINNLNFFLKNENWYTKKGIPYHYGILLHGFPGCGKTSIIKATLQYTKRNAFVIPLNRVKTCGQLENIFYKKEINNKTIPMNKRIYIFEDIDCLCNVVKSREFDNESDSEYKIKSEFELLTKLTETTLKKPHKPDDELNLSCLLNIFDGILEIPGRIIILTSNFPEKIDKALLRPGRIDMNLELKKTSISIIKEILSSFYEINMDNIENLCKDKFKDYVLSPATIMNICQNNHSNINECIVEIETVFTEFSHSI